MKQVSADGEAITFQLSRRERDAFIQILQSYPVVPPAHQSVSKELNETHVAEFQRLLDEALAEQRADNRRRLQDWLAMPKRFQKAKASCQFRLERVDSEWLLKVLNDIRVGNWLLLGSPADTGIIPADTPPSLMPRWLAMHLGGYFQITLLEALES